MKTDERKEQVVIFDDPGGSVLKKIILCLLIGDLR
jgi:hypothetical protein